MSKIDMIHGTRIYVIIGVMVFMIYSVLVVDFSPPEFEPPYPIVMVNRSNGKLIHQAHMNDFYWASVEKTPFPALMGTGGIFINITYYPSSCEHLIWFGSNESLGWEYVTYYIGSDVQIIEDHFSDFDTNKKVAMELYSLWWEHA